MLRHRIFLWLLVVGLCLAAAKLPSKPANEYLNDYANVINVEQTKKELRTDLKGWNAKGKSRFHVVTVSNLSGYGMDDVVAGSKAWFEAWGLDQDDALFLFSVGDRKAWIHLGSDWGAAGQAKADAILRDVVMPPAGHGDYSLAVFRGSNSIHRLLEGGTEGTIAASAPVSERIQAGLHRALPYCEIPWPVALGLFAVGIILFVMGVLGVPRELGRAGMLVAGSVTLLATAFSTIALPVFGFLVLVGVLMLLPNNHHHCHSWFGWGNSDRHHHHHHSHGLVETFFESFWGGGSSDRW